MSVLNRAGLLSIVASLTGLSTAASEWRLDPNAFVGDTDQAKVQLLLTHFKAVGVDEHRYHVSDGTDGYEAGTWWVQELGNRDLIVQVSCESFAAGIEAAEIIDNIRTRIRAAAVTAQLNAIGLALEWMGPSVRRQLVVDQREVSAAAADLKLAAVANFVSLVILPDVGGDFIETVNTTNVVPITETS